jgi:hypothetical protein
VATKPEVLPPRKRKDVSEPFKGDIWIFATARRNNSTIFIIENRKSDENRSRGSNRPSEKLYDINPRKNSEDGGPEPDIYILACLNSYVEYVAKIILELIVLENLSLPGDIRLIALSFALKGQGISSLRSSSCEFDLRLIKCDIA